MQGKLPSVQGHKICKYAEEYQQSVWGVIALHKHEDKRQLMK